MASQSSNIKKMKNGRKIVLNTVKTLNNQVLDTADVLIEEAVNSGLKYQKVVTKAIKKTEPLLDKQVDIIFDTAEAVYDQIQNGNKRFQKLLGITKTVKKAKSTASKTFKAAGDTFEKNFELASKTLKTVAESVEDKFEKIGSTVKVTTNKAEAQTKKVAKVVRKKSTTKATAAKKAVKKRVARARKATTSKK